MRRGLIAWSDSEVSRATLDARLARVHAAMRNAQLDALVLYTNIARPSAVTYLTQFVPYWSHGLLLVLPDERPRTLIVALSKRVSGWIEETSHSGEVISTPDIGLTAAKSILQARPTAARIGVVELERLPAGVSTALAQGLSGAQLEDATALFESIRGCADDAEVRLAAQAVSIASRALESAGKRNIDEASVLVAALDGECRRLGAEEVLITLAPNLDDDPRLRRIEGHSRLGSRRAVRISLAYKGQWVRLTRTLCAEMKDQETVTQLQTWLTRALSSVRAGIAGQSALQAQVADLPGLTLLDCAWHGARNSLPLASLPALRAGALVNADVCVRFRERQWRLGEPLRVAAEGEAAHLLGA